MTFTWWWSFGRSGQIGRSHGLHFILTCSLCVNIFHVHFKLFFNSLILINSHYDNHDFSTSLSLSLSFNSVKLELVSVPCRDYHFFGEKGGGGGGGDLHEEYGNLIGNYVCFWIAAKIPIVMPVLPPACPSTHYRVWAGFRLAIYWSFLIGTVRCRSKNHTPVSKTGSPGVFRVFRDKFRAQNGHRIAMNLESPEFWSLIAGWLTPREEE